MALNDRLTKIGLFGGMRPFNPILDKQAALIGNLIDAQVKNITDYPQVKNLTDSGNIENITDYGQIKRIG